MKYNEPNTKLFASFHIIKILQRNISGSAQVPRLFFVTVVPTISRFSYSIRNNGYRLNTPSADNRLIHANPSGKNHLRILLATVPIGLISRGPWTRSSSRCARLGRACFLRDIPPTRLGSVRSSRTSSHSGRRSSRRPPTIRIESVGSILLSPARIFSPGGIPTTKRNAWSV